MSRRAGGRARGRLGELLLTALLHIGANELLGVLFELRVDLVEEIVDIFDGLAGVGRRRRGLNLFARLSASPALLDLIFGHLVSEPPAGTSAIYPGDRRDPAQSPGSLIRAHAGA